MRRNAATLVMYFQSRYSTMRRLIGVMLLLGTVGGCSSSGPVIVNNQDPTADFAAFQTFGFVDPLGTDSRGARTSLSIRLIAATTRELTARGLQPVTNNPDLLVNFLLQTSSTPASSNMSSASAPFHHGRIGYVTWNGYPVNVSTTRIISEGRLGIDIVDASRRRLVWEGAARDRVTEAMRDNLDDTVDRIVSKILTRFPIAPQ